MGMSMFSFFKAKKPKGFNYKPMYYSEQKEEMKEREARIRKELGLTDADKPFGPTIKGQFKSKRLKKYSYTRQSTIRALIILVLLILVAYFLFFK